MILVRLMVVSTVQRLVRDVVLVFTFTGVGFHIHCGESLSYNFYIQRGQGWNSKAKLLGLWGILKVAMVCGLGSFKIYGDSMFIIKWAKDLLKMKAIHLKQWSNRIKTMMNWFVISQ